MRALENAIFWSELENRTATAPTKNQRSITTFPSPGQNPITFHLETFVRITYVCLLFLSKKKATVFTGENN